MTKLKWTGVVIALLAVAFVGMVTYNNLVVNPKVAEQIRTDPDGELAARAMLLTFSDGRQIPVNYLMEGNLVFVGADGPWWRNFRGEGQTVTMQIKDQTLTGTGVVELDNQAYVDDVFARLRPTVPEWLPDWLNGKLIVITIAE